MNRIGINLWNWTPRFGDGSLGLLDKAADLGFGSAEIGMNEPDFNFAAVRRRAKEDGLTLTLCGAFGKGRDLSNFDEDIRNAAKEYMHTCFRAAEAMGASLFVGPAYTGGGKAHLLPEAERQWEWTLAVEGLREMAVFARECGVTIAIEPLHRYHTSVVNTAAQALQMVKDINEPNVGILFDTYHASMEEADLCAALQAVCEVGALRHFHACENHRGAPGTGSIPWENVLRVLRNHRYKGCFTLELFPKGFMDGPWSDPELSPDEMALKGLSTLRSLLSSAVPLL